MCAFALSESCIKVKIVQVLGRWVSEAGLGILFVCLFFIWQPDLVFGLHFSAKIVVGLW